MLVGHWGPFGNIGRVGHYTDRPFTRLLPTGQFNARSQVASRIVNIDVYQDDENVVVKAVMPGVSPDQIEVTITGDMLVLKGETSTGSDVEEERFLRRECQYGPFFRSLKLPGGLNTDKVHCTYENGVLSINIPKEEAARPKSLKVNVVGH